MPFTASCACGATYQLKDEFAGKLLQCTRCQGTFTATPHAAIAANPQAHPVFDRDRYLLRQKMISISQKYFVSDEQGQPIVYVERPAHLAQQLLALLGALAALAFVGGGIIGAGAALVGDTNSELFAVFVVIGVVLGVIAAIVAAVALSPKRHVLFYTNESKTEKLLDVLQDAKFQIPTATYTLRDADGNVLALLRKNYLYNIIRKRWYVLAPDGQTMICRALEDSILLSLLRRFIGPLFGLLRTNFIITAGNTEHPIGEFNRKFTIIDRYVLDLTPDPSRALDRRIALGLGVMLDTGEKR